MKKFFNEETFQKVTEFFSNKQYRALLFICIYIIFSIILVGMARSGHRNSINYDGLSDVNQEEQETTKSVIQSYSKMTDYSSNVRIMIDGVLYEFQMNRNQTLETITGFNQVYYVENEQFYYLYEGMKVIPEQNILLLKKLHPNNLVQLIEEDKFVTKTEYQDGSLVYVYSVDSDVWNNVMGDVRSYQDIQIEYKEYDGKLLYVILKMDMNLIEIYYDYNYIELNEMIE